MYFSDQFEDRLKEVDVEAQVCVNVLQAEVMGLGLEAVIADEAADDRPVLLLDVGLIVFLVRT